MTTTELVRTPDVNEELLGVLLAYRRKLSEKEIATMLESIKPVVRGQDGELRYIKPVDPTGVSFIWDPHFAGEAKGLREITRIYTLHTWGYQGMFKPSLGEVLSMIPQHMVDLIKAFEIVGPEDVNDLNRQHDAVNAGYHVAVTILYGDDNS